MMLASLNRGKIREYQELFKEFPELQLKTVKDYVFNISSLSEAENGKTYYENAYNKGKLAHFAAKYPTFSDDTGLEVDALNNRPGVHSDRYAEPRAGETKEQSNTRKLLEELKGVPQEKRTARFVCTTVFFVEGITLSASETLEGSILEVPRGTMGFGYDAVFLPKGSDKSLAEMTMEEKNKIGHRGKALRALLAQIREKNVRLVRP
jgi:XTP/dITP diphosphohydrolase